jgi:hypothetical protein
LAWSMSPLLASSSLPTASPNVLLDLSNSLVNFSSKLVLIHEFLSFSQLKCGYSSAKYPAKNSRRVPPFPQHRR